MSRFFLCGLFFVLACVGCKADPAELARDHTTAELRSVKGDVEIHSAGKSRTPYRRDRLSLGDVVYIPEGGLAWMRRDGGATWLIKGPAKVTLSEKKVRLTGGKAFVDTEQGEPVVCETPAGDIELSGARASLEVGEKKSTAYVLRGSARGPGGKRAETGEMLAVAAKEASVTPVVSWQDWTGGLGTADPTAAPAPFGIGTVGARRPGEKGTPRSSLVIERLDVKVTIDHDIAFTEVDQTFVNPTSETVEGVFRFRTPLDATLSQFAVDRDGKLVFGRVKESRVAEQVYESHVYEGSTEDPALLSWESPGVYSARLYPILKGAERRVVTRYSQWLTRQGKRGERRVYVYPMAAEGAKSSLPRIEEMTVKIDVSQAGAGTIKSGMGGVRKGDEIIVKAFDFVPHADLAIELFDDGSSELHGFRASHAFEDAEIPEGKDEEFAREVEKTESDYIAIPLRVPETGTGAGGTAAEGMDLAIVVDTSAATEPAALSISRSLVEALLSHLGEVDRAALFAGDSTLRAVAPGSEKFTQVTDALRKQWLAGLSSIERGGATDLGSLMTGAATALDPKRASAVIYIGDGSPSVGEIAPQDLRERLARLPASTRIIPVAVGSEPNITLLEVVARGAPLQVVEDAFGAARSALTILEAVARPAWIGARVDLGPGVTRVLPEVLPPLAPGETVMVVGRLIGKLPSEIVVKSSQGESRQRVKFDHLEDRGDLRRRWGSIRLGALMEEGAGRATLVDLSERYGLVSPFTSLYVPTRAEEAPEDYEDKMEPYEDRQAKLWRWKPWAKGVGFGAVTSAEPPMESVVTLEVTQYMDESAEEATDNKEGGTGTRAKGEQGAAGYPEPSPSKRSAVKGPGDNNDPHLARQQALRDADDFGMIGLENPAAPPPSSPPPVLREGAQSVRRIEELAEESKSATPSSAAKSKIASRPRGGAPLCSPGDPMCESLGGDSGPRTGNMWGDAVGKERGVVGQAEGGGGLGLSDIGVLGGGAAQGSGSGRLGGSHPGVAPQVRAGEAIVNGSLPMEIVQRIVRQNFGRFRLCYEQGLARNPELSGRVLLQFSIGSKGSVLSASEAGGFDDSVVAACMATALVGLSFPEPQSGTVTVTYPVDLAPPSPGAAPSKEDAALPDSQRAPPSIGWIGHRPVPCGAGADLPLSERRVLWTERLSGAPVSTSVQVYSSALRACEATDWRERMALLVLMVDSLPHVTDRVSLWRLLLRVSPGAADAVYRFLVLRVRTAEDLRQLHEALGFSQVDPDILQKLLAQGKTPSERLTLLRGTAEKYPDDSELALRVLDAYEDAGDEAGGRAWARKLRRRVDATSHLRTRVGEYYLRLAKSSTKDGARDESEGRRTFGEIVEFAPEDPLARRHLGDLLSAHGWHDEALRQYQTLERLTPDDPTVKLLLARATQGTGKTERAVRLAEQAASVGAPDSAEPVTVAARALSSVFLAEARLLAKNAKNEDELLRLRGRAARLAAKRASAGHRFILTWSHPELRAALYTNALGTMMPAADNLPLLRVAEAYVPTAPAPEIELRLDELDAQVAHRLGLVARLWVLTDEGEQSEVFDQLEIGFSDKEGQPKAVVRVELKKGQLVEVSK